MNIKAAIARHLEVDPNQITKITELYHVWCVVVAGKKGRFVSKKKVLSQKLTARYRLKTGSQWHVTERRAAICLIDGVPIYKILTPISQEWVKVGNHGKWCIAEYEIPIGSRVEFSATANGRKKISHVFTSGEEVNVEGYTYGGTVCGWITSTPNK